MTEFLAHNELLLEALRLDSEEPDGELKVRLYKRVFLPFLNHIAHSYSCLSSIQTGLLMKVVRNVMDVLPNFESFFVNSLTH